jgi:hypothetical protein
MESFKSTNCINPRSRIGFTRIFGNPANEDLLLLLVRSIIPQWNISSVHLKCTERAYVDSYGPKPVLNIECNTNNTTLMVRIQYNAKDDYHENNSFFSIIPVHHNMRSYDEFVDTFDYDYYCLIGITDFVLQENKGDNNYINTYQIRNIKNEEILFTDIVSYVTVELPKFNKNLTELENQSDYLFYAILNMDQMNEIPKELAGRGLERLFELCGYANMTEDNDKTTAKL